MGQKKLSGRVTVLEVRSQQWYKRRVCQGGVEGALEASSTSKAKSYPITITENGVDHPLDVISSVYSRCIFLPPSDSMWQNEGGKKEIFSRITNPNPLCMVLQAILFHQWTMSPSDRWHSEKWYLEPGSGNMRRQFLHPKR